MIIKNVYLIKNIPIYFKTYFNGNKVPEIPPKRRLRIPVTHIVLFKTIKRLKNAFLYLARKTCSSNGFSFQISAQESRRKKKEYMDQLERKVEVLVTENNDYRKKLENLEDSNKRLMNELAKLQAAVARSHSLPRHK